MYYNALFVSRIATFVCKMMTLFIQFISDLFHTIQVSNAKYLRNVSLNVLSYQPPASNSPVMCHNNICQSFIFTCNKNARNNRGPTVSKNTGNKLGISSTYLNIFSALSNIQQKPVHFQEDWQ